MKTLIALLTATVSLWSVTIDEAIERAMTASPLLQQSQHAVKYAHYGEIEAEATFHPTLEAGFDWSDVDEPSVFAYTPKYSYNLSARYRLFNGFSDYHGVVSKRRESDAAKLLYQAAVSDLKLNVINAYTAYLKASKAVTTQQEALASLERAYQDTSVRYEQGFIAKNELLLIDVDRLSAQQALVTAKSNLKRTRSHLNRVMGGALQPEESIVDFNKSFTTPEAFPLLLEATYANRSELKAYYKLEEGRKAEYDAARGTYLPEVNLGADYIVNDKELDITGIGVTQPKDYLQTTIQARWELYSGRVNEAARRRALERISEQRTDIEAMKLDLHYQLTDAYEAYQSALSAQTLTQRAKESAEENYRITNERYAYGDVDTLSLLRAQSDLTAAKNAYNDAYYDLYAATAAIERVSGE